MTVTAVSSPRMKLANVVRGRIQKPIRLLVYGVDGIGKSTFAAGAPAPIFVGVEDGTATLDVPRFPEPHSWLEGLAAIDELEVGDHDFRTVVIDTLDWLEPMCWSQVVGVGKRTRDGVLIETIEDIPYGKGYASALDEWRILLSRLDRLRAVRGMNTILLAHAWIRTFRNPDGEDFDRYELKLHTKAASLIREWCDAVLFATHEQYTHAKTKRDKAKGVSTGARILHTQRRAAFDAKNRHNLPETIALDYEALEEAIAAGVPEPPEVLKERIEGMLEGASADLATRVRRAVTAADGNAATLARIVNKLAAQTTTTQPQTQETGT
jgi:AAA domain